VTTLSDLIDRSPRGAALLAANAGDLDRATVLAPDGALVVVVAPGMLCAGMCAALELPPRDRPLVFTIEKPSFRSEVLRAVVGEDLARECLSHRPPDGYVLAVVAGDGGWIAIDWPRPRLEPAGVA
jgi:hypothetical protein